MVVINHYLAIIKLNTLSINVNADLNVTSYDVGKFNEL